MEIHMKKVNYQFNHTQTALHLADALHGPDFLPDPTTAKFNFHVHLFKNKQGGFRGHAGSGCLTLPTVELGSQFLAIYGAPYARKSIHLGHMRVIFTQSNRTPRNDVLETIRVMPYRDPTIVAEEERRSRELQTERIPFQTIQFGWHCRDDVVSVESEYTPQEPGVLFFDEDRRQFRFKFKSPTEGETQNQQECIVAIRVSSIESITAHHYLRVQPALVLFLYDPPTYESAATEPTPTASNLEQLFGALDIQNTTNKSLRRQLSFLPIPDHQRVAPFASLVIRVTFTGSNLHRFDHLRKLANVSRVETYECQIARRDLFSKEAMTEFQNWTRKLNWAVAYQVESILRARAVDPKEMLEILPSINKLASPIARGGRGKEYAMAFLKAFKAKVKALYRSDIIEDTGIGAVKKCYEETLSEFDKGSLQSLSLQPTDGSLYMSLHITVTPTSIYLDGPFPERSNRVIRQFDPQHQESFLRVSFTDEGSLQYRSSDREIDHKDFIRQRFGNLLLFGLTIAKRKFGFLAYSQSALKEHSVWFVKPFTDSTHGRVTADSIIQNLGNFDNLRFDLKLMFCPARYAARLSQAFTATDACVVEVEEIISIRDIEGTSSNGRNYCFTDGVGTLSTELAKEIWKILKRTKRRTRSFRGYPAAYQVRFMGSKGMLSIDPRLDGNVICLRDSMIKFDAPNSTSVEIARSFDRPTAYFLNRPLIMLMEGLGVPFETFKHFQDLAVHETHRSSRSLQGAAKMLETHGLGTSFRMSSVLVNLHKLGITELNQDQFYRKAMEFAINHVLRVMKNHARIPVPGAWTLVGVADIHNYLQPGEIFAYVKPLNERGFYLEGPILISRSPTIHPGDIQLAHAIGQPPPGSPYVNQPLANTVVFSSRGDRPLPSCLGGGDLDGDIYNLIPLSDPRLPDLAGFHLDASKFSDPSEYAPATKKLLDRKSTMADVAEFVMEYISSDVLGMVAVNWLIIADQSPYGIHDPDCITLANLHSDAVDYPKSGNPVAFTTIPRLKRKTRPDWNAPETIVTAVLKDKYYESNRAIGRLFRAIDLPAEHAPTHGATRIQTHSRRRNAASNSEDVTVMLGRRPHFTRIERRVQEFIATEEPFGDTLEKEAEAIYSQYTSELEAICYQYTLSSSRYASLTEEEVLVGTIVQKTSQPRHRADKMAKMREATDILVRGTRETLEGSETATEEDYLQRAWFAWLVSLEKAGQFGGHSFGWVTLGAVFDAIRQIEEREDKERLSLY